MDKNETIKLFDEVTKSIKYFRLKNDLALIQKVIDENQTTEVKSKINVFGKMSNKMKDSKASRYTEKKEIVEKEITKFEIDNPKVNYNLYFQARLNKSINDLFKKDKLGIIRAFYALTVLLDKDFEYEFDKDSLEELSILFFSDKNKINDVLNKFNSAYNSISGRFLASFKLDDIALIKESAKNALVFLETGNKKYLESTSENDTIAVTSSLLNYGLLFGLGYTTSIKIADKSFDKFVKINVDETIKLLTMESVLIDIAYNSHESKDFDEELALTIDNVNILRGFILNQIIVKKVDAKTNKEKLAIFNNFDEELIRIVNA